MRGLFSLVALVTLLELSTSFMRTPRVQNGWTASPVVVAPVATPFSITSTALFTNPRKIDVGEEVVSRNFGKVLNHKTFNVS